MGLFRRDRPVTDAELGAGTSLRLATVDGRLVPMVTWDKQRRRVLAEVQPTLRFLRAAGVAGDVDLWTAGREGEVRLDGDRVLRFVVDPGVGFRVLPDDAAAGEEDGWVHPTDHAEPFDPQAALADLVFAVSSLLARVGDVPVVLPGPVTANQASVQLLRPSGGLPARWAVCVFVTRDHAVPDDADETRRRALWVEHSVGVKLHRDGTIAVDPDDDDPAGERSRRSLATASGWAGEPLDLVPYARWLLDATEHRLGRPLTP